MILNIINTGSSGNSYLLKNKDEALLIECGVNIKKIKEALDFDYSKVIGCLMSHQHGDHSKSVNKVMELGIDVYSQQVTHKALNTIESNRAKQLEPKQKIILGGFKILAFDVKHDVPCLGFLIEHKDCGKVVFITDTYFCEYTFKGLNNIIVEANYSKEIIDRKYGKESGKEFLRNRILRSHFSLENCKDMLASNDLTQVNNIVLIHLSDTNSNEVQFQKEVAELTGKNTIVANNGMVIPFGKTPF
ncbi:MBL fold metallo-hydrolase [Flavobacterium sp. SUN046]|uniref:MBL fold metallo-hydrolase n=1 Tax=Flavobacterium sp. SUN046 TaxID=3002440 RepID=UPI002DBC5A0F|nr:MBL fold metallo-hydrolase [Flavobacterium sp. SUN046]MEC4049769.1 MBL fold metallo-hydrolase [Flavobacterium sp. SUN046]